MYIGGVGYRDEQALATPSQGYNPVLLQQFVGHQPDYIQVRLNRVQIQQRHAEFLRGGDGDLAGVGQPSGDQVRHQIQIRGFGVFQRLQRSLFIQQPVLNQARGQALQGHALRVGGHC